MLIMFMFRDIKAGYRGALGVLIALVVLAPGLCAGPIQAGPLAQEFDLTLGSGRRWEALGPFLSFESDHARSQWGFAPLLSHAWSGADDAEDFDFAYPFLTYTRHGPEYRFQIFQLFSISGLNSAAGQAQRRTTFFPIYFRQRSPDPDQDYTALLPFYGRLRDRLLRDEINFVMIPLYVRTRKGEVITDNYLLPIFHLRHGPGLHGWQVWPLAGYEHKDITTRTNNYGDAETVGGHDDLFVLWPIYYDSKLGIGTDNPQTQRGLLPFYSQLRSPHRDSATYLWPFFTFTDDREKKYREWDLPWPFVVFARGEGKTTDRILPFFSRAHNATLESDSLLWPIYKYDRIRAPLFDRERTRFIFFVYSDLREKNLGTGATRRRFDLWPLVSYKRGYDGAERFQMLALIESFVPDNKGIERDYAPLWSLWRSEKNARTGVASQSLLWNLYRRETGPKIKKCSLLFGLFQYESSLEGTRTRWFYLPPVRTSRSTPAPPAP